MVEPGAACGVCGSREVVLSSVLSSDCPSPTQAGDPQLGRRARPQRSREFRSKVWLGRAGWRRSAQVHSGWLRSVQEAVQACRWSAYSLARRPSRPIGDERPRLRGSRRTRPTVRTLARANGWSQRVRPRALRPASGVGWAPAAHGSRVQPTGGWSRRAPSLGQEHGAGPVHPPATGVHSSAMSAAPAGRLPRRACAPSPRAERDRPPRSRAPIRARGGRR